MNLPKLRKPLDLDAHQQIHEYTQDIKDTIEQINAMPDSQGKNELIDNLKVMITVQARLLERVEQ